MIYLQLFLAFLRIGAFSFGGGYAAMPLIQEEVVNHYHWISMADFTDLVTISQMTPGPIAINAATFIGLQMAGPLGSVAATLGDVLPSCVVVTIIAIIYTKYRKLSLLQGVLKTLRPAVVALIFTAGLLILLPAIGLPDTLELRMCAWFLIALVMLRKLHWDPILVMVLTGVMELIAQLLM